MEDGEEGGTVWAREEGSCEESGLRGAVCPLASIVRVLGKRTGRISNHTRLPSSPPISVFFSLPVSFILS